MTRRHVRERLQRADLVDDVGGQIVGRDVDEAPSEPGEVAVADLGADPDAVLARPAGRCVRSAGRVAGVESARDVGAGDHAEHRVVVAEPPHAEALAEVGVEVDGRWVGHGLQA